MRRLLVIMLLVCLSAGASAQTDKVYKSLKEVKRPEDVYILKLTYKRLKAIPPEVFTFTNLRELNLGCNFIDSVPPEIANLKHLEVLNLERNWLHYLPDEMGQLTNLVKLDLNRNPLQALPASMASLTSLERLVLWSTGVTELPVTFVALDATLKLIDLRECYLTEEQMAAICELLPSVKKYWNLSCNCGK
ncbi:MAG: leucine-rich repeat domain-containing protein [Bacteroidales bacterium]|nr:leucine-rich repeat domain-containing protein [Bacteroidales bacterium]